MKKYSIHVLCVTTLLTQSLLCGDSKYERLLADVDTQNFPRLLNDLQDDEYLPPKLYNRLIQEARQIHYELNKKRSFLNHPRDFWSVAIGAPLTLAFSLMFIEVLDVSLFRDAGNKALISRKRVAHDDKPAALGVAAVMSFLTTYFGYAASRGYNCKWGSIVIDNAQKIVRALEKARDAESDVVA